MARLADTSFLIQLERRGDSLASFTAATLGEEFAVSTTSLAELLFGTHRADSPRRREGRLVFINEVISQLTVCPFDYDAAQVYARIWSELQAAGNLIGVHDMQIAATALARGYPVMTLNVRDFERVPGLTVIRPPA